MTKNFLPLCCSFALLNLPALRAAQGDLDPTWGGTGIVTTGFPAGETDDAFAMTLQGDGKVLLAGRSGTGGDFAVVRYDTDGSLDTTFNGTGRVTTNFGSFDTARSIALQGDGKILLGGYTGSGSDTSFALARYNPDGSLDTSFNGTGMRTLNLSLSGDEIFALTLQSDGKILAAGRTSSSSLVVWRLNSNGTTDTTFNGTGRVIRTNSLATSLALQPDGRIILAGYSGSSLFGDMLAMRINPNGTLDTTFNGTGAVVTSIGARGDQAWGVALQTDGKIVLAGISDDTGNERFAVVRYHSDGSLDTSFNGTGTVVTQIGARAVEDLARDLALQSDGKILVAGTTYNDAISNTDFALVRYNTDGTLDTSFSGDGKVTTHVGSGGGDTAMALQPDGRILVAGGSDMGGPSGDFGDFVVLRYLGATPVPEPGSSLLAASAGALLLARRRRTKHQRGR